MATDTTIENFHKDKISKRKGTVKVPNKIFAQNHGYIKSHVEITSYNQVFNRFERNSNNGRKFKGLGSTSPKVEK